MNYHQYKQYRASLAQSLIFLDDLNPYEILPALKKKYSAHQLEIARQGEFIMRSGGVRLILEVLFSQFSQQGYSIILPEDIYPVYFELMPENKQAIKYRICNETLLALPEVEKSVLLIADPLMPEGRYLSGVICRQLADWLKASEGRWLFIDKVYDPGQTKTSKDVLKGNVIYIDSLSKKSLISGEQGWATSGVRCKGFNSVTDSITVSSYAEALQILYAKAWLSIRKKKIIADDLWFIPETGYVTVVNKNYKYFLENNIAAIPATVYGIKDRDLSVISCLTQVKYELR